MSRKMLFAAAALLGMSSVSHAENNLLFILDASNSMWGQVEGTAKIETAKSAFGALVGQLPPGTNVGLMAYGHRDPSDCGDIEVLAPIGASPDRVRQVVDGISPRGKTPIAASLQQSWEAFIGSEEQTNSVVLISDGIETCEGDPCAVAAELVQRGVNVRVHVVGFDVDAETREQLECIAEKGGGQYFSADSTEGFSNAVSEAVQVAQPEPEPTAPPAPAEPSRKRVFFDDFDGTELGQHWEVKNPDPDAYIVEDGQLLVFSGQNTGFDEEAIPNLVTLKEDFPSGDWDTIMRFSGEFSSGRDLLSLGLRKDHEDFIAAMMWNKFTVADDYHGDQVYLTFAKSSGGDRTEAPQLAVFLGKTDAQYDEFMRHLIDGQGTITLSKRGRSYYSSLSIDGIEDENGEPVVWETDKLTSLRPPGPLTLAVSLWENVNGEILVFVDSIEIVTVEE